MARFPCEATGHRYPGAQMTLYLSTYCGDDVHKWRARLCPDHMRSAWHRVSTATTDWQNPSPTEPIYCPVCSQLDADGYFVATGYVGDEPDKRAGCICPSCASGLLEALGLAPYLVSERPLGPSDA
jgi:hypothetical protein